MGTGLRLEAPGHLATKIGMRESRKRGGVRNGQLGGLEDGMIGHFGSGEFPSERVCKVIIITLLNRTLV